MEKKPQFRIDSDTVKRVARIARLELGDAEIKEFGRDLSDILSAFKIIDKAPAAKPSFQPLPMADAMRDDIAEPCLTQEQALANTQHKEKGFFRGPRAM